MSLPTFTLLVSCLALSVSFLTFIFNVYQKYQDNRRAIRKELTELIKELVEVNISFTKIDSENSGKVLIEPIINQRRSLNTRRRYLTVHSRYLIKKIPALVSDVDYNVIANACAMQGIIKEAEGYFLKAISKSTESNYLMASSLRSYARFLFSNERLEEGRVKYIDALEILSKTESDFHLDAIVDTYLMWAKAEYDFSNFIQADELYNIALIELEKIINTNRKKYLMNNILANNYLVRKEN